MAVDDFAQVYKKGSSREDRSGVPPPPVSGRLTSKTGFTLLELMVVVFVLSLVFALSLASFSGLGESKIQSDAKRVASILRYLNDSAISTKEILHLKVNLKDKTIRYDGPDGDKTETFDDLSGIELQSKGKVEEGEALVLFGPSGAAESFQMRLSNGKLVVIVALNALSGRVRVTQNEES